MLMGKILNTAKKVLKTVKPHRCYYNAYITTRSGTKIKCRCGNTKKLVPRKTGKTDIDSPQTDRCDEGDTKWKEHYRRLLFNKNTTDRKNFKTQNTGVSATWETILR